MHLVRLSGYRISTPPHSDIAGNPFHSVINGTIIVTRLNLCKMTGMAVNRYESWTNGNPAHIPHGQAAFSCFGIATRSEARITISCHILYRRLTLKIKTSKKRSILSQDKSAICSCKRIIHFFKRNRN
nr:hypothetical protein BgiMline_015330 [Biomphalaria glabrata]